MELRDKNGLTESEFLEAYKKKNYPRPFLTADIVVFSEDLTAVLLVKRGGHPYLGRWALPGGFANANESAEETALRELREETGIEELTLADLTEIGLFSAPGRDPRGWVVSNAYAAKVDPDRIHTEAGDDAIQAKWFTIESKYEKLVLINDSIQLNENGGTSNLAFDHGLILIRALRKMSKKDRRIDSCIKSYANGN